MGLISRVSSRTYRKVAFFDNMAQRMICLDCGYAGSWGYLDIGDAAKHAINGINTKDWYFTGKEHKRLCPWKCYVDLTNIKSGTDKGLNLKYFNEMNGSTNEALLRKNIGHLCR